MTQASSPLLPFKEDDKDLEEKDKFAIFRTQKFKIAAIGFIAALIVVIVIILVVTLDKRDEPPPPPVTTPMLYEQMQTANLMGHLQDLFAIAQKHNGSRASPTGYNASVDYVVEQLKQTNYKVSVQPFYYPFFTELIQPTFTMQAPIALNFSYMEDFRNLRYSGSGNVTGTLLSVGGGCNDSDYVNFTDTHIPLIARGFLQDCTMTVKIGNAIAKGAKGAIIYYDPGTTGLFSGGLSDITSIPCFTVTYFIGSFFLDFINRGMSPQVSMVASNIAPPIISFNVIADTPTGSKDNVIVSGSHLDSVLAGPGMNDDGSGSTTNLELAIQLYKLNLTLENKVRFAWWGAEEYGLLGSTYYVNSLTNQEIDEIALNLNFDMLGSPNFFRGVYNGTSAAENIRAGSTRIQQLFNEFFAKYNLSCEPTPFTGRSDYGPFIAVGIPAGGLFTGAEVIKTAAQRTLYGGFANSPYDPCYHQACDTLENINQQVLLEMAQAAAYTLEIFATKPNLRNYLNSTVVF